MGGHLGRGTQIQSKQQQRIQQRQSTMAKHYRTMPKKARLISPIDDDDDDDSAALMETFAYLEHEPDGEQLQLCIKGERNDEGVANIRSVAVDSRLTKLLKSHQRDGIRFMWKQCFVDFESLEGGGVFVPSDIKKVDPVGGCILAHSMGLGKSFQTIALLHTVMTHKEMVSAEGIPLIQKVLLIVPKSTITNWENEFDKWQEGLSSRIKLCNLNALKDKDERRAMIRKWERGDLNPSEWSGVLLATEGVLKNCLENTRTLASCLTPDVLVLDEAHTLICTATKRYEMLQSIAPRRIVALTGSPFQNNPTEFLQMMKFLRPDILGDLADKRYFATKYAKPIAAGMASDATKRCVYDSLNLAQELHDFFAPHVQRVGSSVLEKDLPPIQHVVLNVRQTRIQTSMYTAHKKSVTEATRHMRKKTSFFKYYNTLRPINSHPASLLHRTDDQVRGEDDDEDFDIDEGWYDTIVNKKGAEKVNEVMNGYKIALLLHLLAAAEEEGEKVVVFANSLATLNYIEFALELDWVDQVPSLAASFPEKKGTCWEQSVDYFRIDGSASAKQRGEIIQQFQESETAKAMLLSRAGGIGINLTSANRVVIIDQHFNPTVALQAISRVYRYGQTKPVFVYTMLTQGTMEEKVYGRCVNKTGIALRIVDDKTIERCFTTEELANLSDNYIWFRCDKCFKYRLMIGEVSDKNIPDVWECSMNLTDSENNHCGASEKTQAWYENRSDNKKGSAKSDSSMQGDDNILEHILSVAEEGKRGTLVCDHHFHEVLMETETVTDKLEQARQELADSDDAQEAMVNAALEAAAAGGEENSFTTAFASLFKKVSGGGGSRQGRRDALQSLLAEYNKRMADAQPAKQTE